MSSKRVEAYRRTTARLLEQERQFLDAKEFLRTQSLVRRAEVAAWLLASVAADALDLPEGAEATLLAEQVDTLTHKLSQRAGAGAAEPQLRPTTGETSSRATETPAAAPVPSTVPSAVSKP